MADPPSFKGLDKLHSDIEAVGSNRLNAEDTSGRTVDLDESTSTIEDPNTFRKVEVEKVVVLSFRTLQLQRIAELQDELLGLAVATAKGTVQQEQHKDVVDKALRAYADALRNYETLSLHAQPRIPIGATLVGKLASNVLGAEPRGSRLIHTNPFVLHPIVQSYLNILVTTGDLLSQYDSTTPSIVWRAVRSLLSDGPDYENRPSPSEALRLLEATAGNLGFRELDQRGREERSQRQAFTQRVVMAMFGGAALIGPMLIMTLHPSRNTSLITVSVATFLFALLLAFIASDSAGKDVLGATAAYAAVLVVFVGTSMAPSS